MRTQCIWTAMRPGTRISYSLRRPHSGPSRAKRGKKMLATSRGLCRDIKGGALDWFVVALVVAAAFATAALSAQTATPAPTMRGDGPAPAPKPFNITRSDPGLDAVVDANTKAELLATGFGLNEGPVWVREGQSGYLLVGGLLDNVIYKVAADKTVSVFMEKAGYSGTDVDHTGTQTRSGRSHVLLIGPSCASLDSQGRVIWCADNDRAVMRLEKDGTRTKLSGGSDDGKRFSGPNDIVVAKDDAVYLTDNDFGLRDGGKNPDKQMPNGIWRIKDGKSTMVLDAMVLGGIPNGIVLSPDEKYLYANAGQRMFRYEVKADGSLGPGSMFTQGPGIGDGMKVDTLGNVYSTSGAGPGVVRVTAPTGTLLGYLNLPIVGAEPKRQICATNVAFGDLDAKSLYVTACDHVYRIRIKVAGVMPGPAVR
jgi:gluconolactonase